MIPGVQTVRRLSLDLREAELAIDCVTHQGIPLGIRGVVIYKVGDDFASIANAARRFLDQQDQMDQRVHNVFAGHLRAIVGNMTVEEMIRDREKLTQLTRESSGIEMEKLGLIVDSLQIQEIDDPTGYITEPRPPARRGRRQPGPHRRRPHADREATEREQEAEALKAEARRTSSVKQAGYQAEVDQAAAIARQAGPLSEADGPPGGRRRRRRRWPSSRPSARSSACRRPCASRPTPRPTSRSRWPRPSATPASRAPRPSARRSSCKAAADAQRVKLAAGAEAEQVKLRGRGRGRARAGRRRGAGPRPTRPIGQAEADATQAKGMADGEAVRAKGMAEAEAIKARADALAENQDAVIGQQLAENWPAIVEAAAKPFGDIDQMIVLNGAQGLSDALAQALSQGVAGLQMARNLLSGASNGSSANGKGDHAEEPKAVEAGAQK